MKQSEQRYSSWRAQRGHPCLNPRNLLPKSGFCALLLLFFALLPCQAAARAEPFPEWLEGVKREAAAAGIRQATLNLAFQGVTAPDASVLKRDHTQPEQTVSFASYLEGQVTTRKINQARTQWRRHRALFARLYAVYRVPTPILLALWGTESDFGAHQGHRPLIPALATLAYDGRRSAFFRKELLNALIMLEREHVTLAELVGSWAGAMGEVQFMPSSFLRFAVDFDGDGRKDIWKSDEDALASMANYLHQKGWDASAGWGHVVHLSAPPPTGWHTEKTPQAFPQWQQKGLVFPYPWPAAERALPARLVLPDGDTRYAYLALPNYEVLMDWNHSTYFATAIGLLANAIAGK